jgi:glycosyltransferase involved in cell wall biosynthesis
MDSENKTTEISIVMPCLNEGQTLEKCICKARKALEENGILGEIIIADNGSTDTSREIAKRLGARLVEVSEKGYGAALMGGIASAQGDFIVMGDADDSYDFSAIMPFVEKLREGYDLVMGCRFPRKGGKIMPGAMPWTHRWIGNPVLSSIGQIFYKTPVVDFHCGLRAFRRSAYAKMDLRTTGMEFASEMVMKTTLKGMRIAEVPITLYKDGRLRPPHLRSISDGWRHLRFMLLFSPRWLFLIPGLILVCLGILLCGILWVKDFQIGPVHLGINTLLVASMAVLLGVQLIIFALFTKAFAISEGFLPPDPRIDAFFRKFPLEKGILIGFILTVLGLGLLLSGVIYWSRLEFGPLPRFISSTLIIPSVILVLLGIQIVFSSFFLSILSIHRK